MLWILLGMDYGLKNKGYFSILLNWNNFGWMYMWFLYWKCLFYRENYMYFYLFIVIDIFDVILLKLFICWKIIIIYCFYN